MARMGPWPPEKIVDILMDQGRSHWEAEEIVRQECPNGIRFRATTEGGRLSVQVEPIPSPWEEGD